MSRRTRADTRQDLVASKYNDVGHLHLPAFDNAHVGGQSVAGISHGCTCWGTGVFDVNSMLAYLR